MNHRMQTRVGIILCLLVLGAWAPPKIEAGGLFHKRPRPVAAPGYVVPTARFAEPGSDVYPMLGTFFPTPTITLRGNYPTAGGYAPLGEFGDTTMALYGPLSSLRATSAPVLTYARGYDGRPVVLEGTSFSTPNLPSITPVVYPTQATYYYGFRQSGNPPWWTNAINWIDQN
jgi:hypothetical protein